MNRVLQVFSTVLSLALLSLPASAVDLSGVDRSIVKEPAYRAKTQRYCLLVFGPEAKTRVWLVLDGETLFVDRNGNGDLTDEGENVAAPAMTAVGNPFTSESRSIKAGDLAVGGLTHADLEVTQMQYRRKIGDAPDTNASTLEEWQASLDWTWLTTPDGLAYSVAIKLDPKCYGLFADTKDKRVLHFAWIDRRGHLAFAARAQDAPVIHFGGPLTLRNNHTDKLQRSNDHQEPPLMLGTPGLGHGTFAIMSYDLVPENVYPVVELEFPPKVAGEKPVTCRYVLKGRC
ncbi:MAG: hypothetical protein L0Z55_07695 [Planctomycetes bacterium]|nr:hypothetical protein [Planctomycetota bacterium]